MTGMPVIKNPDSYENSIDSHPSIDRTVVANETGDIQADVVHHHDQKSPRANRHRVEGFFVALSCGA